MGATLTVLTHLVHTLVFVKMDFVTMEMIASVGCFLKAKYILKKSKTTGIVSSQCSLKTLIYYEVLLRVYLLDKKFTSPNPTP